MTGRRPHRTHPTIPSQQEQPTSAGTITITAGRPNREGEERDFAGPEGTYPVTLVAVSDRGGAAERSSWLWRPRTGPGLLPTNRAEVFATYA
jgi:hypothetical protein